MAECSSANVPSKTYNDLLKKPPNHYQTDNLELPRAFSSWLLDSHLIESELAEAFCLGASSLVRRALIRRIFDSENAGFFWPSERFGEHAKISLSLLRRQAACL